MPETTGRPNFRTGPNPMKKIILASVAALAFAATASAQQPAQIGGGDITRSAAVADAERRFAALDADGSGQLEAAEMQQITEQRRAERRQQMEARLAAATPEQRAQFEQGRAERRAERASGRRGGEQGDGRRGSWGQGGERGPVTLAQFRAQAEQRFDRLDLNHDGVITRAEQEQLRAQRSARSPSER